MPQPHVCSETGPLRRAVVHSPGRELSHVSPSNRADFLFSDVLYERHARREHNTFVALLRDVFGVEVQFFRELLTGSLLRANSMDRLRLLETVGQLEELSGQKQERLLRHINIADEAQAAQLTELLIAGEPVGKSDSSVSGFLNRNLYHLPPIPNLMLVRDLAAVVGNEMFVAWNSEQARKRENLLWRFVLQHSEWRHGTHWHNWMLDETDVPERPLYALEGGNVVQPAEHVLVVGQSLRTGSAAAEKLASWLWEHAAQESHLFLVMLPEPLDHLDTVFGMISQNECVVFPPSLFGHGPESVNVLQVVMRPGQEPEYHRQGELIGPLGEALGVRLHAVSCGGSSPLEQRREQWWGGASILAVAPGKLVAFRSAERTLQELEARGYVGLDAEDVLGGKHDPYAHEKCVVLIRGAELSRAKGGPRSLVLPLARG